LSDFLKLKIKLKLAKKEFPIHIILDGKRRIRVNDFFKEKI